MDGYALDTIGIHTEFIDVCSALSLQKGKGKRQLKQTLANIIFAKRRANMLFEAFVLSINFVRVARKVLFNPDLHKHFYVIGNFT